MLIIGKAVLAFGVFSVFGAAVHNRSQVGSQVEGVSSGLIIAAPTAAGLPRGYWSNPATSPLQGIGMPAMQSPGPIRQPNIAWHVEIRREVD